ALSRRRNGTGNLRDFAVHSTDHQTGRQGACRDDRGMRHMQRSGLMLGGAVMALALSLGAPALGQDVDFGEDTSTWANDGQCDDPRFSGPGAALIRSPVDELRDATDCRTAFEAGEITLAAATDATRPATAD